ncbi:UbiA family prenyltransferase [Frateuria soli]|uniref:UbiA family prenyltransferase n=1 Tax=Frateuria soli TaxID=1542730 RepID=UPI001E288D9E|nr:UbiA family prenyltransferase [Frateuria soli]UGB39561.1 UbiA family prenyltransferase [Frateuria soli]
MRKYLALSRSTHGLLDIAMTGFAALLWLGHFPAWPVLAVALVTAAAGYTALYALNDLVGVTVDREKFAGADIKAGYSVEASDLRYPIAQGKLSLARGVAWFALWYLVALVGAWWLNPFLVLVVLAAPVLETAYCLLLKVTWWRTVVSGLVKSLGPVAAVLVVVPQPSLAWLGLMVAWLVAWEMGGQNIPADWNDVEEDRRVGARTIPVVFGPRVAGSVVLLTLAAAVVLGLCLPVVSPLALGLPYQLASLVAGVWLLLWPGLKLFLSRDGRQAARLFDRASLYPLAQLAIVTAFVLQG